MSKSTNFSGQPILNQLIMFLDKGKIRKIAMQNESDKKQMSQMKIKIEIAKKLMKAFPFALKEEVSI